MFADLADSVRLIQENEALTILRWREFASSAREAIIPAHHARLVRTAGDALLIECSQVADAVALSAALHASIATFDGHEPGQAPLQLRIGVHLAEVLFDEYEAYGAGVNLAARLATLAQPGDTVLSSEAREQLIDPLHGEFEDLGLKHLKNLPAPVRAFRVWPGGLNRSRASSVAVQDLRPSVAVLPLEPPPGDDEWAAVGHAVADDVIGSLTRQGSLRVLSRASTAALAGVALGLPRLRELLGAQYLVSGRCHRLGQRLRLNVELCEMSTGTVLWTGQMAGDLDELFAGHDQIVPMIVAQISQHVLGHELKQVRGRLPLDSLPSYTLYLGGQALMNSLVAADFQRAHDVFDHLAQRHTRQSQPRAMLARWHVFRQVQGWSGDLKAEGQAAWDQAQRALDIDADNAVALQVSGLTRMNFANDIDGAGALYQRALEVDPGEALAWACLVAVHSFRGEHEQAMACAERALALSPLDPSLFEMESYAAMAALGGADFDKAIRHASASLRRHASHKPSHRLLISALWLSGRESEARAAAARLLAIDPNVTVGDRWPAVQGHQPVWFDAHSHAQRAAGLPRRQD